MTKLKTLKDFKEQARKEVNQGKDLMSVAPVTSDGYEMGLKIKREAWGKEHLARDLKQEAINWVNEKEIYEKFDHTHNYWLWVFKNFFNITEEDLK